MSPTSPSSPGAVHARTSSPPSDPVAARRSETAPGAKLSEDWSNSKSYTPAPELRSNSCRR